MLSHVEEVRGFAERADQCIAYSETDDEVENSMKDEVERRKSMAFGQYISLGRSECSSVCDRAEQCCRCRRGRPLSGSRAVAGGSEEVRKTVGTAKHVHVSGAEDAAMNEGKQSLQRDVNGSRCLEGVCGKNMLDVCLRTSAGRSDTACTHKC